MRVALVSTYRQECGIATYTDALGQALRKAGCEVEVMAMDLDARAHYYGRGGNLPYTRCWSREGDYTRLTERLHAFCPTVTHIQHEYGCHRGTEMFVDFLHHLNHKRTVMTLHTVPVIGREDSAHIDWLPRVLQSMPAMSLIAHQEGGVAALRAYGCLNVEKIKHGTEILYASSGHATDFKTLGIPANGVVATTLGFWTPGKRNDQTITAVARLKARGLLPANFVLVIAGQPMGKAAADDMAKWCASVESSGLTDTIRIRPGFVDEALVPAYFSVSDFFILNSGPTMWSTSGRGHMVMGYGAAAIAADVPLLSEFKHCGLTFRSTAELENAILKMLDPETRADCSRQAAAYAVETRWEVIAAQHMALYDKVAR